MVQLREVFSSFDEIHAFLFGVYRAFGLIRCVYDLPPHAKAVIADELHYYYAGVVSGIGLVGLAAFVIGSLVGETTDGLYVSAAAVLTVAWIYFVVDRQCRMREK